MKFEAVFTIRLTSWPGYERFWILPKMIFKKVGMLPRQSPYHLKHRYPEMGEENPLPFFTVSDTCSLTIEPEILYLKDPPLLQAIHL